jgi:hypoxanthine phosphoribosyltransferase
MNRIKLHDKEFDIFIPYEKINEAVKKVAQEISKDLKGEDVLFICILNGSFMFTAELFKEIELDEPEVTFLRLSSYEGTDTTGQVKNFIVGCGLEYDQKGRHLKDNYKVVD